MKSCYIHIPFCSTICTYCDFCKMYYNKKLVNLYLDALDKEIDKRYKNEILDTIYVGGGTPSCLDYDELNKLLKILNKLKVSKNLEYTFEANVETLTLDKIILLKQYGVNRISIGIQTIKKDNVKFLGRNHTKKMIIDKIKIIKENGFNNINVDLMYAIPGESLNDLKNDLSFIVSLDVTHISTYSLIIEPHTMIYINGIKNIDEDLDCDMYRYICEYLKENGYNHYEISNFSKLSFESKHNLTYWNNLEYYGFGLGASGYIGNTRYDNTRNLKEYLSGNYVLNSEDLDLNTKLENEFILGLRKIKGINKKDFYNKFGIEINSLQIIKKLLIGGKLEDDGSNIFIKDKYIYTSNFILTEFIGNNIIDENNCS